MRKRNLFLMLLISICGYAQINESFSDGDFAANPAWTGHTQLFNVNDDKKLQSTATSTSVSWLVTPSESINNAVWQADFRINYTTSASNYAAFYLVASDTLLFTNCNGYFVQIGGTNDEVSLYYQQGNKKTKIIDGADKRTDGNPVQITIKAERDSNGKFTLYSKLATESVFYKEGEITHGDVTKSIFAGLLYSNTSTTGNAYFFDNILITGDKSIDVTAPVLISCKIISDRKLRFETSEAIQEQKLTVNCDAGIGNSVKIYPTTLSTIYEAEFSSDFQKGKRYQFGFSDLTDLEGNTQDLITKTTGIIEKPDSGEVILNEVMFHAPKGGQEYVEVYNISHKLIQVSDLRITTRKTDLSLNIGFAAAESLLLEPNELVAFAIDPDSVLNYHQPIKSTSILKTKAWSALNNESATLVLCNQAGDTILDELTYSSKWHHVLISDKTGVALERMQPNGKTQDESNWHSAATEVRYGTPGYENSQRYISENAPAENVVWCEPEAFSPNNDGNNDICYIRFKPEYAGFVANVQIFSAGGTKIAQPAANFLLSTDETIPWDGKNTNGSNVQIGIYVLYVEMFHPLNGTKLQKRMPLVVTSR